MRHAWTLFECSIGALRPLGKNPLDVGVRRNFAFGIFAGAPFCFAGIPIDTPVVAS